MRILSSRAMQIISFGPNGQQWLPLHTTPHKVRLLRVTIRSLPHSSRPCLAGTVITLPDQRQYHNVSTPLTKVRDIQVICKYPLSADDCKGRLELPRGLNSNIDCTPRVPYSIASRLTHPPTKIGFGLRCRLAVVIDRMVFINQFPCIGRARSHAFQFQIGLIPNSFQQLVPADDCMNGLEPSEQPLTSCRIDLDSRS